MATSHPIVDDVTATVQEVDQKHKALLQELTSSPHQLVHPPKDAVVDRSAPVLEPGLHLERLPHQELLQEIASGHALHHVEAGEVHDASAPRVEKDVVIQPNKHAELMDEVKAVAAQHTPHMAKPWLDDTSVAGGPLKHVETEDKTDLKHVLP